MNAKRLSIAVLVIIGAAVFAAAVVLSFGVPPADVEAGLLGGLLP